jgi:hypothetical protein
MCGAGAMRAKDFVFAIPKNPIAPVKGWDSTLSPRSLV